MYGMAEQRSVVQQPVNKVQSVDRALHIVDILADPLNSAGLGLREIAGQLGVAKSTAHALLATLHAHGYVARIEPGPRFTLGMSLLRLGNRVEQRMPLKDIALPILSSLAATTRLTARLVLADHGFPLYIARVEGVESIQFASRLGKRELPHSTGVGKAILASMSDADALEIVAEHGLVRRTRNTITDENALLKQLDVIRANGYAIDDEEDAEGIVCVAAGVRDGSGDCVAAMSVSSLSIHMAGARTQQLGELVKAHAEKLSLQLGATITDPTEKL